MDTIITLGLFAVTIVMYVLIIPRGLDLKKWSSWLYGAIMFGCFFVIGFLLANDIKVAFEAGTLNAFMFMYSGVMRNWHKKLAKDIQSRPDEAADPCREERQSPDQKKK